MNNIMDIKNKVNQCTSCGMCSAVCPKDAIHIELDKDGFYKPVVNESKCISCGICKKTCYCFDLEYKDERTDFEPICYSAINKDEDELFNASSGAVSIELMRACLSLGYYIVGVAYDYEKDIAISRIARKEDELKEFRGSKYFQSYTEDAFREIASDKTNQKYAIFGTPCQIYAFSKLCDLKKNRDRFMLVDIFCHGCPSMLLWKKYINDKKKEYNVTKFDYIKFRSKTHSWHEFCFDFLTKSEKFSSDKYNDPFYEMFFGMDIMNEACYNCIARSSIAKADIRLGDFWGWQYDLDKKGVSAVVLNSERGGSLFKQIENKFKTEVFEFDQVIEAQSYGKEHTYNQERRDNLLSELKGEKNIEENLKDYRKMFPKTRTIKRILKNMLKRYMGNQYIRMRQKKHSC